MTFEEYCRFGYVSRLQELRNGGGPTQDMVNSQRSYAGADAGIGAQQNQNAQDDRSQGKQLQDPLIAKEMALAGGDRRAAVSAAMPTISKLSEGFAGAKQSIFNSLPAGAGRDKALAGLEIQKDTGIAQAEAAEVNKAPEILANIGSGLGAFSLQELGASLSGYSGASTANQAAASLQMQQQQAKWGPIVGLAQAAGSGLAGNLRGSDRRLKSNIEPMVDILRRIRQVPAVTFEYSAVPNNPVIGVIAQDLLAAQFPQAVRMGISGTYSVDYGMLAAIALGAVRELAELVEKQQAMIDRIITGGVYGSK